MMFRRSVFAGVCALAFVSVSLAGTALAAKGGEDRPFRGVAEGSIVAIDNLGATVEYEGNATHLGRFTRTEILTFSDTGQVFGTITFTAANGDELDVEFTGAFVSASEVEGTYTIVGGTGRFEDATGDADFSAVLGADGTVSVVFDGTISY